MKVAYLYPGQGSQQTGMCRAFFDREASVRARIEEASALLGYDLGALMFEADERLNETEYTQPAMVAAELAMTEVVSQALSAKGIHPAYSAGLSLGEYAAIAEAGGLSFAEAVQTVAVRGKLMAEAVPSGEGAMAAVLGAENAVVEAVIDQVEGAYIANYNCPGQLVITGWKTAVEQAVAKLGEAGVRKCVMLKVSGPFHSPLLAGAGEKLAPVLAALDWKPLSHPYVANVNAEAVSDIAKTPELLTRQVASSVLWEQSVAAMLRDGVDTFVEIGPGKTLSGFVKKIVRKHAADCAAGAEQIKAFSIETPEDLDKFTALC